MTEYVVEILNAPLDELRSSMNRGEIHAINPDGSFVGVVRKALVEKFNGLKIEVFANEHPPPHFRVKFQDSTANFRISDCEMLNGAGEVVKYAKNVELWWRRNKAVLIAAWNSRRPSDCPVGLYRGED